MLAHWTSTRLRFSSNPNLHAVGTAAGLEHCIFVNPMNPVAMTEKIVSNAVEAVIGATFLDGRLAAARKAMEAFNLVYAAPGMNVVMLISIPLNLDKMLRINLPVSLVPI